VSTVKEENIRSEPPTPLIGTNDQSKMYASC